jgi:hypothetical protein
MTRAPTTAARPVPAWPKDALRISFGIIWLIDAILKWLPGFRSGHISMISSAGQGQPGWLAALVVQLLDQPAAPRGGVLRLHGGGC